jgi:uncharacterized protein YbjQ (UPF0145 family)
MYKACPLAGQAFVFRYSYSIKGVLFMWECMNCSEVHEDSFEMCLSCGCTREGEQPINFMDSDANADKDYKNCFSKMIFSTTQDLKTHTIKKYLGVVTGEAILGANVLNDIQKARQIALKEMAEQAFEVSADAIIGITFDYETIRGSMLMVICSGTAVAVEEIISTEMHLIHQDGQK